MKNPFTIFILLQVLDLITTVVALGMGAYENNPMIARLIAVAPMWGLLASKIVVISIAGLAVWIHKDRGIARANAVFSLIVVWNLSIITRLALTR